MILMTTNMKTWSKLLRSALIQRSLMDNQSSHYKSEFGYNHQTLSRGVSKKKQRETRLLLYCQQCSTKIQSVEIFVTVFFCVNLCRTVTKKNFLIFTLTLYCSSNHIFISDTNLNQLKVLIASVLNYYHYYYYWSNNWKKWK